MKRYFLFSPTGDSTGGKQEATLIGVATEDQIKEWKAKYKYGIYALSVDGHIAYFKNPGRNELNCAMSKADRDKALHVFEELATLTFIGGSNEILTDDQMFIGISQELKVKLEGKKATLVNL
ncbi:hypothetical protein CJD36_019855 [Flavipsychrobacter stenotrophus]|uniref:Uncharacterized protein n=1 Tax=Flavipsychrobacter stenotrophus TaxID=2077091 RepID=A0A2S7SSA7_9BACT|nr:hypothetical protein [Flavipsychrobacter stenotrophus]PQJ09497.1 hypothetical protein CJD36_019855 [Flavipsychrobacter stenotrophus]